MHTPEGFITSWICVVMLLASAVPLAWAVWGYKKWLTRDVLPRMALLASVIFLLQMLNFPVANGTSGHFMGAALAAILVGPEAALIVVASVIATQALVFGDGGFLALGVNIFNMAVVGVFTAHVAYSFLSRKFAQPLPAFFASWLSVVAASAFASALLSLSGLANPLAVFSGMLAVHAIIGVSEGVIGVGALALISSKTKSLGLSKAAGFALAAFAVAALAIPLASGEPDGMEKVSINLGFYNAATTIYSAPIPDYSVSGVPEAYASIAAGAIGAAICFALFASLQDVLLPAKTAAH